MISFDKIDQHDWRYDLLMLYLSVMHNHIYYHHIHILNRENIPQKGQSTIVIANHQNGLMDAMAVLHTLYLDRRQPIFIAKGSLFKQKTVARLLRFLKLMPTFRSADGNRDDLRSNLALYQRAAQILKDGGTIVIFPEATHHYGHYLSSFKKGFGRIAFSAEEINDFKLGLQVLPMNIHYSNYFNFHSDLMVTVGTPFTFEEFFEMYRRNPNDAYLALNQKAHEQVKQITPDIDIPEYRDEIETITQLFSCSYLQKKGLPSDFLPNQKEASMTIIANLRHFREESPETFVTLMEDIRRYTSMLTESGLTHPVIIASPSPISLALRIIGLIVLSPLFLFGYINNFIPRLTTRFIVGKTDDPMMRSSLQYGAGIVLIFPLWYLLTFVLAWVFSGHLWFAAAYIILTILTGFLVHYYKIWCLKLFTFFRKVRIRKTKAFKEILQLNQKITGTMEDILH